MIWLLLDNKIFGMREALTVLLSRSEYFCASNRLLVYRILLRKLSCVEISGDVQHNVCRDFCRGYVQLTGKGDGFVSLGKQCRQRVSGTGKLHCNSRETIPQLF